MTVQYSVTARNNRLDSIETTLGASPILKIRTGAPPASCAAADVGTALVAITLPADWMAGASGGQKAKSGTWNGTATAGGTAGHFRIYDSSGTTCHMQGTITSTTTGTGDMLVDNTSIATSQTVTVNTFQLTGGNA
jgi:hypothetical protein